MIKKRILKLVFIAIWILVIFSFSAENGTESNGTSDKILIKIAEIVQDKKLDAQEQKELIAKYSIVIRKSAHFTAYFILGILVIIFAKDLCDLTPAAFLYSLSFCFIYACTDEIHQLFISGRTGSPIDVLIDTSGALLAITIFYLILKLKQKCIKTQ